LSLAAFALGQFCNTSCPFSILNGGITGWSSMLNNRYIPSDLQPRDVVTWAFDSASPAWWQNCGPYFNDNVCPELCYTAGCFYDFYDTNFFDTNCPKFLYDICSSCFTSAPFNCSACRPDYIYLFRYQFRVNPSTRKFETALFLDLAYQPANWQNTVCFGENPPIFYNGRLPTLDSNVFTLNFSQSAYLYTSTPGCYSQEFCSLNEIVPGLGASHVKYQCQNPDFINNQGYPSTYFCGQSIYNYNINLDVGCIQSEKLPGSESTCASFKFNADRAFRRSNEGASSVFPSISKKANSKTDSRKDGGFLKNLLYPGSFGNGRNGGKQKNMENTGLYGCSVIDFWRFLASAE